MAKPRMDLSAFVGKLLEEQDGDVLREGVRVLAQALMETRGDGAGRGGAPRAERRPDGLPQRDAGSGRWDTRVGTVDLAIPKVRPGTYFPSLLQPRRRAEQALLTVVQEAYVHGVSTRKVDDLVKALGLDGISKSEVSRICAELDPVVEAFRTRPLTGEYPYVWLDATYHKVRIDGRVVSQATVVAIGVTLDGERQILGVDVGASEDRGFWTAFLRSLVKRGLAGVRLGDLRRARRAEAGDQHRAERRGLATLPRAFHAESAGDGAAGDARADRGDRPDDLRAARSRERADATAQGRRRPARAVAPGRGAARGGRRGHPGAQALSRRSIAGSCTARIRWSG